MDWIDPSGMLSCQTPNPCSELKGVWGACVAAACSAATVKDMIEALRGAGRLGRGTPSKEWVDFFRENWGRKFSPEECCKSASGTPDVGSVEAVIRLLCSLEKNLRVQTPWEVCRKKFPKGANCIQCCNNTFGENNDRWRCRRLCGDLV